MNNGKFSASRTTIWLAIVSASLTAACGTSDGGGTGGGSSSTSSSTSGNGGNGGGDAAEMFGSSPCGTCVHASCQSAFDACSADPECPAYATCLDACPLGDDGNIDAACADGCPRGTGTESKRAAAKIDACRDPGPGAACGECGVLPRGGAADVSFLNQTCGESLDPLECIACQDENCCETYEACIADPECQAYRDCIKAAGEFSDECAAAHPAGIAKFAPDMVCAIYHCAIDQVGCDPSLRDPCLECAFTKCTLEWAEFQGSDQGFLLGNCIGECPVGDDVCDEACYDQYPGGQDAALAFGECALAACSEVC